MKSTVIIALLGLAVGVAAGVSCTAVDPNRETCGNGLDDDGNGLIDCADPDCAGQANCPVFDAGYFGPCAKCGTTCTSQNDCVSAHYVSDRPIPTCTEGRCTALNTFIQVRIELDTKSTWASFQAPQSGTTRFIEKTTVDGGAVSCAVVAQAAADRARPDAIEDAGVFNVLGLDVTPIKNPQLGQGVTYAYVNTATGSDFLIWTEFWVGPVDSLTKLPTAKRLGYGCFEAAADVEVWLLQSTPMLGPFLSL